MGKVNIWWPPTPKQVEVMRVLLQGFALPSLIGAAYIVQHVLRSKKRRGRVFTRIMLGMSVNDLIFSFCASIGVWIAPAGTFSRAAGTWASCEAFGYFAQSARLASILYNVSLAHYYLLTIRFGWSEWKCRKRVELWIHLVPLLIGWGITVVGFPLEAYNPYPYGCAFRTYPFRCGSTTKIPCIRGNSKINFILDSVSFYVPFWITFAYIVVAMCMIYRSIAAVEEKSSAFSAKKNSASFSGCAGGGTGGGDNLSNTLETSTSRRAASRAASRVTAAARARAAKKNDLKRKFSKQALFYCLAFVITWIFASLNALVHLSGRRIFLPTVILSTVLGGLQGFWNAVIYVMPRYLRYRNKVREAERVRLEQLEKISSDHKGEAAAAKRSRSRERISALRQALSVAAEDDEDDYEYIVFAETATPQEEDDDASLVRMVHFGTPVVAEDYVEPGKTARQGDSSEMLTAAATEKFDGAETKGADEPGSPVVTLEEILVSEDDAKERIRDSAKNLPVAATEYTSHGIQLAMPGLSEDATSEGHQSTDDAVQLAMPGESRQVAISGGQEESTNDAASSTSEQDLPQPGRRASF